MSTFLQKEIVTILLTFQTFYVIIILEVKTMTIGDRIKKIRLDSGETQETFAENLNLTKSTISIAESNKRNLSRRVLIDISNKYHVNLTWLEEGQGEPYEESEDTILRLLKAEFSLDEIDVEIIKMYLQLTPEERAVFKKILGKNKEGAN